jgi:hypothetical protein
MSYASQQEHGQRSTDPAQEPKKHASRCNRSATRNAAAPHPKPPKKHHKRARPSETQGDAFSMPEWLLRDVK